jgi:predicted N-formylglutamate amidohydrolase
MTRHFTSIIITCEHASNAVPAKWRGAFLGSGILKTHRAWDPGAALLARELAVAVKAPAFFGEITRLLVDLNRSQTHRKVFSEFTPEDARDELLQRYWRPYREQVGKAIQHALTRGPVLHLSVHSFTPVLDGETRNAEIGLLYDPARRNEREFCTAWRHELRAALPATRVRMNYPYRGTSDGCTTAMRKRIGARYAGMELEINQAVCGGSGSGWAPVRRAIVESLARVLV